MGDAIPRRDFLGLTMGAVAGVLAFVGMTKAGRKSPPMPDDNFRDPLRDGLESFLGEYGLKYCPPEPIGSHKGIEESRWWHCITVPRIYFDRVVARDEDVQEAVRDGVRHLFRQVAFQCDASCGLIYDRVTSPTVAVNDFGDDIQICMYLHLS